MHVPKSEYSGLALGGGSEEIDVAYAGRSDGLAVNDFEGLVPAGVKGGEHALACRGRCGLKRKSQHRNHCRKVG